MERLQREEHVIAVVNFKNLMRPKVEHDLLMQKIVMFKNYLQPVVSPWLRRYPPCCTTGWHCTFNAMTRNGSIF